MTAWTKEKPPTLWVYELGQGWFAHIDWHDGALPIREGPFESEGQARRAVARMNGMEPPP